MKKNVEQVDKKSHSFLIHGVYQLIFTTCKRSLGQGNIFTSVCQEFCSVGRCYPSMHCRWYPSMPCSRSPGGSAPGGCLLQGVCSGGVCSWEGGCLLRGVCSWGGAWWRPPWDGYCCGRYASYWNAFLLSPVFPLEPSPDMGARAGRTPLTLAPPAVKPLVA